MGNKLVQLVEESIKELEEQEETLELEAKDEDEKQCEGEDCEEVEEDDVPCESCGKDHDDEDVKEEEVCEDCDEEELKEEAQLDEEIKDLEEKILGLSEVLKLKKTSKADRIKARKYRRSAAGKKALKARERDPKYKREKVLADKMKKRCENQGKVWSKKEKKCTKAKERRGGS